MSTNFLKITGLLLFVFSAFLLKGQEKLVQNIRTYYYDLKEQMSRAPENVYSEFYVVKIEENIHKVSVPAVGNYYGEEEMWYLPNEEDGSFGRNGVLVYRSSTFQISARKEFTEYVFKDGKLIFCFIKIEEGAEHRYYFQDEKLIHYVSKGADEEHPFHRKEDWKFIVKNAKQ